MPHCPICQSTDTALFLQRSQVPVHQNLLMPDPDSAAAIPKGDLDLTVCNSCGFVFNAAFDLNKLQYGDAYENTQTCSAFFQRYVDDLVQYLLDTQAVQNSLIVEVGCGKGGFLKALVEAEGYHNRGVGFDPSYVGPEETLQGRLVFEKRYYDEHCTHIQPDIVISRHVIEHVPDPVALLKTIKQALRQAPNTRLFFETPCIEWILKNEVIWDFFYEHCSYFSAASLKTAFEIAGFEVSQVKHIFGGQYLWLEARNVEAPPIISQSATTVVELTKQYARSEQQLFQHWKTALSNRRDQGKIALWGAGAKGVTFANLVDPRQQLLDCVVDLNPKKQGNFIPGTGHPIVDYRELAIREIKQAVLMNENYREENLALLKNAQLAVEFVES